MTVDSGHRTRKSFSVIVKAVQLCSPFVVRRLTIAGLAGWWVCARGAVRGSGVAKPPPAGASKLHPDGAGVQEKPPGHSVGLSFLRCSCLSSHPIISPPMPVAPHTLHPNFLGAAAAWKEALG